MSRLRDRVKQLVRDQLSTQTGNASKYQLGTVVSVNADGTVTINIAGTTYVAGALYPLVQGQQCIAVFGDGGKISAVPTRQNAPEAEIIVPPFFSGKAGARFVGIPDTGQSFTGLTPFNGLFLQEVGNKKILFLDTGVSEFTFNLVAGPSSPTFPSCRISQNGRWLGACSLAAGVYPVYHVFVWDLTKLALISGSLLDPAKDIWSFTPHIKYHGQFDALADFSNNLSLELSGMFVDNDGIPTWTLFGSNDFGLTFQRIIYTGLTNGTKTAKGTLFGSPISFPRAFGCPDIWDNTRNHLLSNIFDAGGNLDVEIDTPTATVLFAGPNQTNNITSGAPGGTIQTADTICAYINGPGISEIAGQFFSGAVIWVRPVGTPGPPPAVTQHTIASVPTPFNVRFVSLSAKGNLAVTLDGDNQIRVHKVTGDLLSGLVFSTTSFFKLSMGGVDENALRMAQYLNNFIRGLPAANIVL